MRVQIIGSGQLGSRHLQALKGYNKQLDIVVVDKSVESLKVAKERYDSISGVCEHKIQYSEVPVKGNWDLLIVASNSEPRRKVIENFLNESQAKFIVLEKILFVNEDDYNWANKNESSLKNCWVNCCMRQMPVYQDIKKEMTSNLFTFSVTGSNYGLVTNAIHYFDYACHLASSTEFTIDTSGLAGQLFESKRKGYFELNGELTARFKNGSVATVTCFEQGTLPISVEVHSAQKRFVVMESERRVISWSEANKWQREEKDAVIPYQSQLTTELVKEFANSGTCVLPQIKESIQIHLNLLNPLKKYISSTSGSSAVDYPFT